MASTSTYPQTYLSSLTSYESREAFAASQRAHENSLRALFAQGATDPAVRNPYTNLIQVHDAAMEEAWKYAKRFEEDAKVPVLFPLATLSDPNKRSVVSRDEFLVNWRTFTEYLDWSNVFAAGGAVQACLSPLPAHVSSTNIAARRDHLRSAFPAGDIDLFIWGVDEEGAKKKMEEIYEAVKSTVPFETVAIRSSHAVTIVSQFPFRHIQIILRLYHSPTEILAGFDVDSCAFGFDGAAVYCSPRSHLASVTRRNTVDMSRRSPSYEVRLAKYAMRGFEIEVGDSLKRDRIDPQIFERPFDKLQGLARLLLLEAFPAPSDRMSFKEASRERRLRPKHERAGEYRRRARGGDLTGDGVDANDYSSVFMPYGEGWNARRIVRQAQKKDYVLNAPYTRKLIRSTSHHQHPCFWGDMSEIFHDCCKQCPPLPADVDPKESDLFVRGPLTFITDDPGRQHVGSFNPITEGDWTAGAYISEASEGLFRAVAARDVNGVRKAIESGADVNGRDHAGRAPLHLAAVCGATEVVKVLLDAGSKISVAVPDGRGVLHLCAEYGALEEAKVIVIVLAQNKKNIDAKTARETAAVAGSKSSTDDDEGSDNGSHGGKTEEEYDIVSKSDESFVDVAKELGESKQKEPFNPFKAPAEEPEAEEPPADDIIDIEFEDWDMKMTALHFAIFYGELDLAKLFLQAGASKSKMMTFEFNVNSWTKTKGVVSPLVLAMMCPDREAGKRVLTYLLEENFPVNQVNHDFYTPLAIAVRHGLTEFVRLLLEEHPRTKLAVNFPVHDSGKLISPMKLAVDTGDLAIVKLLHEAGSKVALDESDVKRGMAVINKEGEFIFRMTPLMWSEEQFNLFKLLWCRSKHQLFLFCLIVELIPTSRSTRNQILFLAVGDSTTIIAALLPLHFWIL
ncbi:ankyrin [Gonapodya prolifera JEL478]|uniref:Ankyrin n=1 Tax=Gonapodya prolifera (strain JEL478) TaxID=1344416 RepID=A0A139A814_GONPJ|nr:ankyrin [Gonapodya prolifera JEL478]|eukprot:KXS12930.1 ankyrin [Gonapodya prolifera JEL478]